MQIDWDSIYNPHPLLLHFLLHPQTLIIWSFHPLCRSPNSNHFDLFVAPAFYIRGIFLVLYICFVEWNGLIHHHQISHNKLIISTNMVWLFKPHPIYFSVAAMHSCQGATVGLLGLLANHTSYQGHPTIHFYTDNRLHTMVINLDLFLLLWHKW